MADFLAQTRPAINEADDLQDLHDLVGKISKNLASDSPDPELVKDLADVRSELTRRTGVVAERVHVAVDTSTNDLYAAINKLTVPSKQKTA
jgi:hypothetical protein